MAVLRSNVISRKSTTFFLLVSMVICKLLCLKILHSSFLIASTCLGVFVQVASPSFLSDVDVKMGKLGQKEQSYQLASLCTIETTHCCVEVRPYFAQCYVIVIESGLFGCLIILLSSVVTFK